MTQWHITATYPRVDDITDTQRETLARALPGYGVIVDDGTRWLHAQGDLTAATIRQATDQALTAVRTAWAAAFGVRNDPSQLRILTAVDHDDDLAHPQGADLVGWTEIGEMLGVSKQRASQLLALPEFPAPIAILAMGRVFARRSVELFRDQWKRTEGRPRKTA